LRGQAGIEGEDPEFPAVGLGEEREDVGGHGSGSVPNAAAVTSAVESDLADIILRRGARRKMSERGVTEVARLIYQKRPT
jgi:hypothetical protein